MFVPDGVVTNERLSRLTDTTEEWIVQRTGIEERRFARRGVSSVDLGVEASRRALEDAGLEPGAGLIQPEDLVCFTALGAGLHWGAGLPRV